MQPGVRTKVGAMIAAVGLLSLTAYGSHSQSTQGAGPATVDQLPDVSGTGLEAIWDEEWQQHLLSAALEQVKQQAHLLTVRTRVFVSQEVTVKAVKSRVPSSACPSSTNLAGSSG